FLRQFQYAAVIVRSLTRPMSNIAHTLQRIRGRLRSVIDVKEQTAMPSRSEGMERTQAAC
ncbi:hypothetical protein, partial [Mesorhizobium sp.]